MTAERPTVERSQENDLAEVLITTEDAALLSEEINKSVRYLEHLGFTRGQIGAAMGGVGFGLIQVNDGHARAVDILNGIRDQLVSDTAKASRN